MQDSHHSMELMSMFEHARKANQLANREAIDEAVQKHGLPKIQLNLLIAHASDLSAPPTVNRGQGGGIGA